jgi:mono/diheme cytochrome c family protein
MDDQPRVDALEESHVTKPGPDGTPVPLFADGRAMRPAVPGTVSAAKANKTEINPDSLGYFWGPDAADRSEVVTDEHLAFAISNGKLAEPFPAGFLTDDNRAAIIARGKERFRISCAACHAQINKESGEMKIGHGPVSAQGPRAGAPGLPVVDLMAADKLTMTPGHIFRIITAGGPSRVMQSYATQVPDVRDRWAIAAYIKDEQNKAGN